MKLMGTAMVCVAVAFGAAFLVAHAADNHSAAKPVTIAPAAKTALTVPKLATASHLAVEFAPELGTLKLVKVHRPARHVDKPAKSPSPAAGTPSYSPPASPESTDGSGSADSSGSGAVTPPVESPPAPVKHSSSGSVSAGSGSHKSGTGSGSTSIS